MSGTHNNGRQNNNNNNQREDQDDENWSDSNAQTGLPFYRRPRCLHVARPSESTGSDRLARTRDESAAAVVFAGELAPIQLDAI